MKIEIKRAYLEALESLTLKNDSRYYCNGAYFDGAVGVACDGILLLKVPATSDGKSMVAKKACKRFIDIAKACKNSQAVAETCEGDILAGDYPPWEMALPSETDEGVFFELDKLISILQAVRQCFDGGPKATAYACLKFDKHKRRMVIDLHKQEDVKAVIVAAQF